jgi:ubiquinol-cytochrome c reductase cytochrome b subunit
VGSSDQKAFLSYFAVKDLLFFLLLLVLYGVLIVYSPNALGHPDNYTVASQMVTPVHIVPE